MQPVHSHLERAVLVAVDSGEYDPIRSLAELAELADTAGAEVIDSFVQSRPSPDTATFVGEGKLQEIQIFCEENQIDLLIFDEELTGSQIRNIETITGLKVIDRTTLILDIFAQRARSHEGRLQVELAQQKYRLPRLIGMGQQLSRLGGGIGTRGPGETKLESDRRHIRRRIHALEEALEELSAQRARTRERRKKNNAITVALVGYTNVGKSTLLNQLTASDVYVQNQLFATLDPTARELILPNGQHIILIDTVGLIQRLPHQLIEAFHSTLEAAADADIILNVCDYTSIDADKQLDVTRNLLAELGCGDTPIITVYNKIDRATDPVPQSNNRAVFLSALDPATFPPLFEAIEHVLSGRICTLNLLIPYSDGSALHLIREHGQVQDIQYQDDGIRVCASIPKQYQHALAEYQIATF
ncbi:MAG: GTPase HflX [Candidatus Merdivicinus sp.]|jgi:GTP-binding protein HflX